MHNLLLLKTILEEWIKQKSDDLATIAGSATGFVVSETNTAKELLNSSYFFDDSYVLKFIWTVLAMIIGGVLTFWAKKFFCDFVFSKFKKKNDEFKTKD